MYKILISPKEYFEGKMFLGFNALATILLSVSLNACGQNKVNGTDYYEVNGKVRSIKHHAYQALKKSGVWLRDPKDTLNSYRTILFGENGDVYKEQEFSSPSNKLEAEILYEYKDNVVNRVVYYSNGQIIKTDNILEAGQRFKILKMFSQKNALSQMESHGDTMSIKWNDNRIVTVIMSDGRKNMIEYDKKRNRIKETPIDRDGKTHETTLFEYLAFDSHGNWTKRAIYSKDSPVNHPFIEEMELTYY